MAGDVGKFNEAINQTKIPVLILDNKWHRLFGKIEPTKEINELSGELSELLKRQGKIYNRLKDLKSVKSNLMSDIINNMDGVDSRESDSGMDKKLNDNKRLIGDVNDEIEKCEDDMKDIPREIETVNKKLMLATMEVCYDRIDRNTKEIDEISEWISNIRIELKKNIVRKQDREIYNAELYAFMHNIFGPEVMELFDMQYVPSIHKKAEEMNAISEGKNVIDDSGRVG